MQCSRERHFIQTTHSNAPLYQSKPCLTWGCLRPIRIRSSLTRRVTLGDPVWTLAMSCGTTPSHVSTPQAESPRDICRFTWYHKERQRNQEAMKHRHTKQTTLKCGLSIYLEMLVCQFVSLTDSYPPWVNQSVSSRRVSCSQTHVI